jgi:hypothetical protein
MFGVVSKRTTLRPKGQALMAMQASLSVEVTDQTKYPIPSLH